MFLFWLKKGKNGLAEGNFCPIFPSAGKRNHPHGQSRMGVKISGQSVSIDPNASHEKEVGVADTWRTGDQGDRRRHVAMGEQDGMAVRSADGKGSAFRVSAPPAHALVGGIAVDGQSCVDGRNLYVADHVGSRNAKLAWIVLLELPVWLGYRLFRARGVGWERRFAPHPAAYRTLRPRAVTFGRCASCLRLRWPRRRSAE